MADEKGRVPAGTQDQASNDDAFDRLFGQLSAGAPASKQDGGASQVFSQAHTGEVGANVFSPEVTGAMPVRPGALQPNATTATNATLAGSQVAEQSPTEAGAGRAAFATAPLSRSQAPASAQEPTAQAEAPGDFTRIFTRLPTPSSTPPAVLAEIAPPGIAARAAQRDPAAEASLATSPVAPVPQPPAAGPGEFTRFYQALTPAAMPGSAPGLQPAATPAASAEQSQAPSLAGQAFAPPPLSHSPVSATNVGSGVASQSGSAGGFTASFQAASPSSPVPQQAFAPAPHLSLEAQPLSRPAAQPAVGFSPAGATAAQPDSRFTSPAEPASGGFTELLRSLATDPAPSRPAPAVAQPPAEVHRESAAFAPPFSAPQSAPPGSPGEFTQLLASLKAPKAETLGATPVSPAPTPFFAGAGGAQAQSGPSEYTRILQGSAARSAEVPVPAFAPSPQAGGAAIGLPIAAPPAMPKFAPPPAPAPAAAVKTTLQKLMPWLLAANAIVLLAIVALVLLYLRHKH